MIDGENYAHLKYEFISINKKDIKALKEWFDKYAHLTNNQLARLLDISNWAVRDYKNKAGIKGKTPKHRPRNINWSITTAPPKNIPRDIADEELTSLLKTYSISQISKSMGISAVALYYHIKKRGISYRKKDQIDVSKNPCCSYEWLYENYFLKYRSCTKCAELAGVYPQTIASWLNKFKIPMLNRSSGVVWLSDTVKKLQEDEVVNWIKIDDQKIQISYHGFIEYYYYNRIYGKPNYKGRHFNINEKEFAILKQPRVNLKYSGTDLDKPNDTVYALNRKDLNSYNLIERRLAIHRFMHKMITRGYKRLELPEEEILDCADKVRSVDGALYRFKGGYLSATPRYTNHAGKKLILSHYDMSEFFKGLYNSKTNCYWRLNKLLSVKTRHSVDELSLQMLYPRPLWFDYIMLAEVMRDIGLDKGPILDISPLNRFVSVTAARLNVPIFYPSLEPHKDAADRGFFDKLKLEYHEHDDEKVQTVVAIYVDRPPEVEVIKKYLKYGKRLIVITAAKDVAEWRKSLPAKMEIKTRRHPTSKREFPIFVY